MSTGEATALNNDNPTNQNVQLGSAVRTALQGNIGWKDDERIYVDGQNGNDNNTGESWDNAFATIQAGLNKARYVAGTTNIDDSKDRRKYVFVYPGVYNEQILFSGYNISLIGLMYNLGNVDYGVVINKNEAVTTTCVVGFTGAGIEIAGLQIRNAAAIPTLWAPSPGDGCWIHDCFLDGDDTNATYGIAIDDCRNTIIENNRVYNMVTAGIQCGATGGYFRNSHVRYNTISGTQGRGIVVPTGVTCSAGFGSVIAHNYIMGTCAVGIHNYVAGAYVLIADNWIQATAAVTDAGTGAADNHTAA